MRLLREEHDGGRDRADDPTHSRNREIGGAAPRCFACKTSRQQASGQAGDDEPWLLLNSTCDHQGDRGGGVRADRDREGVGVRAAAACVTASVLEADDRARVVLQNLLVFVDFQHEAINSFGCCWCLFLLFCRRWRRSCGGGLCRRVLGWALELIAPQRFVRGGRLGCLALFLE